MYLNVVDNTSSSAFGCMFSYFSKLYTLSLNWFTLFNMFNILVYINVYRFMYIFEGLNNKNYYCFVFVPP